MTTLHEREPGDRKNRISRTQADDDLQTPSYMRLASDAEGDVVQQRGSDRREYRRHDLEQQGIPVDRWDNKRRVGKSFGQIVDISAGGVRIRTTEKPEVKADGQIRIRMELPDYAGISPFIDNSGTNLEPKREWIGWMQVARVSEVGNGQLEIGGRLIDMDEIDRGMLGLYLSTQPLAA